MGSWTATAPDGAMLQVTTVGAGPGVIVVQGGGVSATDYVRLARALAPHCTVHTYDRRGHAAAAPMDDRYGLATELDDLRTLIEATGATGLLGHSVGAFFALQAALRLPVVSVAVYDPAVAVDGLFPTDFLAPFGRAVDAGDLPLAMAVMSRGLRASGAASNLPIAVQRPICRVFLATGIGRRMGALLPAVVHESGLMAAYAGPSSDYAGVTARALFVTGTRSPRYYAPICDRLAAALSHAESIRIPGASHNAANIARPAFVAPFAAFFTGAGAGNSAGGPQLPR